MARFDAVSVGGVDEALEQLAQDSSFDLVLADELMPVKGGLDLLGSAALRSALQPLCRSFCCRLFGTERDLAEGKHRPDAVGLKPIRAVTLTALIDQVLTGKSPAADAAPARRLGQVRPFTATASCWWKTTR